MTPSMNTPDEPPFTLTPRVLALVAEIGEALGRSTGPQGVGLQNLLGRALAGELAQDIGHRDTKPADAGFPRHHHGIECNAFQIHAADSRRFLPFGNAPFAPACNAVALRAGSVIRSFNHRQPSSTAQPSTTVNSSPSAFPLMLVHFPVFLGHPMPRIKTTQS